MNLRQASHYLGVSPDTLYRYICTGMVPAFKLGSRWKFRKIGAGPLDGREDAAVAGQAGIAGQTGSRRGAARARRKAKRCLAMENKSRSWDWTSDRARSSPWS